MFHRTIILAVLVVAVGGYRRSVGSAKDDGDGVGPYYYHDDSADTDQFSSVPKIKVPKIKVPEVKVPEIKVPKVKLPNISLPKVPKIQIPKLPTKRNICELAVDATRPAVKVIAKATDVPAIFCEMYVSQLSMITQTTLTSTGVLAPLAIPVGVIFPLEVTPLCTKEIKEQFDAAKKFGDVDPIIAWMKKKACDIIAKV